MKHPLIKVIWADHWQDAGDFTLEEVIEKAQSYCGEYAGFLVYEDEEMLVIAGNVWEDGSISDPMYIMKSCIINRSDRG